jgi:hypothetical protein
MAIRPASDRSLLVVFGERIFAERMTLAKLD